VTIETVTLRCDRCGKHETTLDVEHHPVTYAQGMVQIQGPNGVQRQVAIHLCPECLVADSLFPTVGLAVANSVPFVPGGNRKGVRSG
jgi:hypothetical protein